MIGFFDLRLRLWTGIGKTGPPPWGLPFTEVGDASAYRTGNVTFALIRTQLFLGFARTRDNQTVQAGSGSGAAAIHPTAAGCLDWVEAV